MFFLLELKDAMLVLFNDILTADNTAAGDDVDIKMEDEEEGSDGGGADAIGIIGVADEGPGTPGSKDAPGFKPAELSFFDWGFTLRLFSAACFKPALKK